MQQKTDVPMVGGHCSFFKGWVKGSTVISLPLQPSNPRACRHMSLMGLGMLEKRFSSEPEGKKMPGGVSGVKDYKFQEGHTSPAVSYWAASAEISLDDKTKNIFFSGMKTLS